MIISIQDELDNRMASLGAFISVNFPGAEIKVYRAFSRNFNERNSNDNLLLLSLRSVVLNLKLMVLTTMVIIKFKMKCMICRR